MSQSCVKFDHIIDINIPFPTEQLASQAATVLSADSELKKHLVYREIRVDGPYFSVVFQSNDLKFLRVSVDSFLDNIILMIRTVNECGDL
ncbi:hypothetical protein T552_02676 [Pneumocystis carinii B80]|uniref:Transcription factor Pcc1 n=1 Tax=Pneumocystis carinii (strain B80) TaxID=1408658 RepID=A0A0W4ZE62_PNEC8|nr:hypothetical protein T552_02676 [Pneumocystis carinii B80]KTW26667.1 hypothetical protein T552_02676 [Pneumocystis carinii B80]